MTGNFTTQRSKGIQVKSTAFHLKYLLSSQYVLDIMVEKNEKQSNHNVCLHEVQTWGGEL